MHKEYSVKFNNVCKIYDIKTKNTKNEKFYALKNISFKVEKGEIVGILGTNGSGKSTLSSIIAGISTQNSGRVTINGEQSLIAINTGLNKQLTGLENIKAKGALLGLSKKRIEEITNGVIEFAELGDFLYQPVKNYSSGMRSRLGFSISIFLDPDIIIIDEALSVGDSTFASKCINKIKELGAQGKTIFFVSHSLQQVKSICTKALWIEGGVLKEYGDIDIVSKNYIKYIKDYKSMSKLEKDKFRETIFNNRLVEKTPKNKPLDNSFYKYIIAMLTIILTLIISISFIKRSDSKEVITVNNDEKYSCVFLVERNDLSKYKNKYRTYIDKESGNTISGIIEIRIGSNSINVGYIPVSLQTYYKKNNLYDEARFLSTKNNSSQIRESIDSITSKKVDDIFTIKEENLISQLNDLKLQFKIINNKFIFNELNKGELILNNDIYNEKNSEIFLNIIKSIFNTILNKENNKLEDFTNKLLIDNNKENTKKLLYALESNDEFNINDIKYNFKTKNIKEFVDEKYSNKFIDKEFNNKQIVFLDEFEFIKNIYFKDIKEDGKAGEANIEQNTIHDTLTNTQNNDYENDGNIQSNQNLPSNTVKPNTPERPSTPERPGDSDGQINPEKPSDIEKPSKPDNSVDTENPSKPEKPIDPEKPIEPEKPTEPEKPSGSEEPNNSENRIN